MQSMLTSPLLGGAGGGVTITRAAPAKQGLSTFDRPGTVLCTTAYDAASTSSQELAAWNPRSASADAEIIPSRDRITARARSLYRNSGWAQGGIEKRVDAVVGPKIWLRAKPDFAAMGQSAEWASKWAMQIESLFGLWANSIGRYCDVERHHSFGGLVRLAYQHYVLDGEAAAPLYWLERGGMFATSVMILDPDRIDNPDGKNDDKYLRAGVQLDANGAAVGYWVRNEHENDIGVTGWEATKFTFFPREDSVTGRPMFIHVFDKKRAHQRRGLGRLTSVMARMKMLDQYDRTELQAAITNAIFGLYAKTRRSSDEVSASLAPTDDEWDGSEMLDAARAGFYDKSDLSFAGVRLAVLPDGDEIDTIEATRPATNFQPFQRAFLNSIAAALGISGEQLSNEWSGINYSNARTLLNEIWRGLLSDRHLFTQSFCTPIYAAFLEEAIARDLIEVPGGKGMFYVFRDALCQCDWIGPGRGYIDPKKEMDAANLRVGSYISNLPDEAAEQGNDWQHNLWQAKRVLDEQERYGLTAQQAQAGEGGTGGAGGGANSGGDNNPDAQDNQDRQEAAGAAK